MSTTIQTNNQSIPVGSETRLLAGCSENLDSVLERARDISFLHNIYSQRPIHWISGLSPSLYLLSIVVTPTF
jgi:hypothetical protein